MIDNSKLHSLIKTLRIQSIDDFIANPNKDIQTYITNICKAYNDKMTKDTEFMHSELKIKIKTGEKKTEGSRLHFKTEYDKESATPTIKRLIESNMSDEVKILLEDNARMAGNFLVAFNRGEAEGSVIVEETVNIIRDGAKIRQESKIVTKKIVAIELNTSIASNILKKINKKNKFLKQFTSDYIRCAKSNKIEYNEDGDLKYPALALSIQIRKILSDRIKDGKINLLDDEEISLLEKHLLLAKKAELAPIEMLEKMSEIGFNVSKEFMTTITTDKMMAENKQIVFNQDKLMEEEKLAIENKKTDLFNTFKNFNFKKTEKK